MKKIQKQELNERILDCNIPEKEAKIVMQAIKETNFRVSLPDIFMVVLHNQGILNNKLDKLLNLIKNN